MNAKQAFAKLGYEAIESESYIHYKMKNDYEESSVTFQRDGEFFSVHWSVFVPFDVKTWEAQKDTMSDWDKHSCKSGHWQAMPSPNIGMPLFKAIAQQIKELGW